MPNSEKIKSLFSQADELNQKTHESFKKGDTDELKRFVNEAIVHYQEILNIEPKNAKALYLLGNKYYEINEFNASLSSYDKAIDVLKSENDDDLIIDVRINRTGTLCELERFDESIADCNSILTDYAKHHEFTDIESSCNWIKNNCAKRKKKG
ncbi:MAG: hypothetical protein K8S87_10810 [Planctomycetes bacterium]|nr:hypothetical protein [Planctomycetota bacterium]